MNIWIVNLKSCGSSTTDEMKKSYIDTGTCGMGWRLPEEIKSKDEYIDKASNIWSNDIKKITLPCNNYHRIEKNDIILTRIATSFYIGRIDDDEPFYGSGDTLPYNISSWMRKVSWYLIGNQDETPAPIVAQLSARYQKTIDIRKSNEILYKYCEIVLAHLSQTKLELKKIEFTKDNFATCFDDQDLEDIVGVYLQKVKKHIFFPSSCKKSTKDYEYILRSQTNKIVYVQVKHNADIDVSTYTTNEYNNSLIYLYSNKGYINLQARDNIVVLSKEELFDFVLENFDIFQKRMLYTKMLFNI